CLRQGKWNRGSAVSMSSGQKFVKPSTLRTNVSTWTLLNQTNSRRQIFGRRIARPVIVEFRCVRPPINRFHPANSSTSAFRIRGRTKRSIGRLQQHPVEFLSDHHGRR